MSSELKEVAAGVACLPVSIANVYFVGAPLGKWALVDTGVDHHARAVRLAAESRFGPDSRPECIVLTHGHFDHAGNARTLADHWNVPVYAHHLEMPYLTGRSEYPPADPTAPGFMSFLSRFFSTKPLNIGDRVRELSEAPIPGMPDWRWLHTPGHSPGHVSLFRTGDATLLAGDAFATVNLDSPFAVLLKKQKISRPPTPFTCDWHAASASVRRLDALNPLTFACGHGVPMTGPDAAEEFAAFAWDFPVPSHGRYVDQPANTDEKGIVALPPPPPDPAPGIAGALGIVALSGLMFTIALHKRQRRSAA